MYLLRNLICFFGGIVSDYNTIDFMFEFCGFGLQLDKYKINHLAESDIKIFCNKLRGYSGADIEQIVSTVKQKNFSSNSHITTIKDFDRAMNDIKSVEFVMHDQIEAIRKMFNKYGFRSVD